MTRDIFEHLDELAVTEPSFIVASGPSGRPYYDLIPPSKFIAGVNAAIVLPLQYNLWVCTTPSAHFYHESFWTVGINSGVPSLMREEPANVAPDVVVPMQNDTATYTMRGHSMARKILPAGARTLDEGASTVGVVTALLVHCGVRDIITCGLEFQGNTHFDGTPTWKLGDDIWEPRRQWYNKLIERAAELGVRIRSLHPVHPGLNLECVPPAEFDGWRGYLDVHKHPRIQIDHPDVDNEFLRQLYDDLLDRSATYGRCGHGAGAEPLCRGFDSILDIGGGYTSFAADTKIANNMRRAAVADISDAPQTAHLEAGTEFAHCVAQSMPFDDNEFELGVCFDVMEHIPPDQIDIAFAEIFRVIKKRVVFSICYKHSVLNPVVNGRIFMLHLTLQPESWWIDKLKHYGVVTTQDTFIMVDQVCN